MSRLNIFIAAVLLLGVSTSCSHSDAPVVIHVFRDIHASFVEELKRAELQFSTTQRRVKSGKPVIVATNEGTSFQFLLTQFKESAPEVVIFDSQANIPFDSAVRSQLAKSELVCGQHPSFIPTSISGEEREAAEMYVRFLVSQCPASVSNSAAPVEIQTIAKGDEAEKDPHRPPCTSARCRKIKKFLKDHYCGESPAGNGPDDGCDIRGPKKPRPGTKVTAAYVCEWNDTAATEKCEQRGQPSAEVRKILLREMRQVGLPTRGDKEVHFTVLESTSGWSLMAANYDHIKGADLILCQVVVVVDQSGQVHALRRIPLRKTNADVPEVTKWSPVDIADVDGDGNVEVVLEGDAYEDHWFEIVRVQDGSFKTIFSGLGYYL
jgi:hypothetical protein